MTKRKVGELERSIVGEKVRYTMNKGKIVLRSARPLMVKMKDGSYDQIKTGRIALYAEGAMRQGQVSQGFDLSDPEQREQVEWIDDLLERQPEIANVNGIQKLGSAELPPPGGMLNWDTMSVVQIKAVLDGSGLDLAEAMKYELQKEEPRDEVIKTIEQLHAKAKRETVEQSDVAPTI